MKKRTTIQVTGVLLLLLALWFLSADVTRLANAGGSSLSRLPDHAEMCLNALNTDIAEASTWLAYGDAYILLQDKHGQLQEYSFESGILWKNGSVLMHHVQSFHFEFRDCYGYRLTRLNEMSSLESVGYTIRLADSRKQLIAGNRILLDRSAAHPEQAMKTNRIISLNTLR